MTGSLDGRRYLEHLGSSGVRLPALGSAVVLALHPAARPNRARRLRCPFGLVDRSRGRSSTTTVSPLGPGAAVAAMTVEMLHALGVKTILGVGVASAVQPAAAARNHGSVLVVEGAVGTEAVSAAYSGDPRADAALVGQLCTALEAERGRAFSTAVPFRLDLDAVARSSADVIDMEAAALFSAANAFGLAAGLAVVISDTTGPGSWVAGDPNAVRCAVGAVAGTAREILAARP